MTEKLVAEKGLVKGLVLSFENAEEWIIGRNPDECQLVIEDPKVSRQHIRCRRSEEGIILENLSSTNPVVVNQINIDGPYLLQEGDRLKIGNSFFRFRSEPLAEENKEEEPPQEACLESETENKKDDETPESFENAENPEEDEYYETIYTEREVIFSAPIYTPPSEEKIEEKQSLENSPSEEEPAPEMEEPEKIEEIKEEPEPPFLPNTRWLLKVMSGPMKGVEYNIEEEKSYTIGSDNEHCDIFLHDISVSRKHASIKINEDETIEIEDLQSRNGTLIDNRPIEEKSLLNLNDLVSLGTTSFLIIDKERKLETFISTLPEETDLEKTKEKEEEKLLKPSYFPISIAQLALFSIIFGILSIIAIGTVSLFESEEVSVKKINLEEQIQDAISQYPNVEFNYSKGHLFILGHVTTTVERDQLVHALMGLPFIKNINNNIVIDELVWQETNLILAKNPAWNSITLQAPRPGQFVLTGYLQSSKESETLTDYINVHFPYLDKLSNQVVVEEQLIDKINVELLEHAFHDIFVEINNGELTLSGYTSSTKAVELQNILSRMKSVRGIRSVKNFVVELAPEESMIDLSERYEVTGHFRHANVNVSVVINGRILARGDTIDGMTITSIKPSSIFLEKDGFKFKIDYNK